MTQRRYLVSLATLALTALVGGVLIAQQGPPPGQAPGPRPQMGPPPAQGQPPMQGPPLTDDQVLQLQALAKEQRDRLRPAMEQARKIREDLMTELWSDKPDDAKVKQLRTELLKAEQEALAARLDFQAKRAQVFTPDQRRQMRVMQARQRLMRGDARPGQGAGPAGRALRMRRGGVVPPGSDPAGPSR